MGNSASSQGSSTETHDGDVGSSISEEQHDCPIEQAADTPEIQSLQEMRKPYSVVVTMVGLVHLSVYPHTLFLSLNISLPLFFTDTCRSTGKIMTR